MSKKASSPSQSSKKRSTKAEKREKAQTATASPFEVLCEADERINPAIILAEELMRKDVSFALEFEDLERAEQTRARFGKLNCRCRRSCFWEKGASFIFGRRGERELLRKQGWHSRLCRTSAATATTAKSVSAKMKCRKPAPTRSQSIEI